ncbi:hypothetical protein Pyn_28324 [Prunus yedoensis var. nudiflora]|uniref:Vps72/YL1 C-terminal domain-containing protein n=1 Tax=Prunus yedoensis var. nudiflora TaxID=2094558 RepID=A0A314YEA4_PRUYE|nr:hypothetical protein Pyn_28324 [Prunus yedoensis var. nudiflora]
MNPIYFIFLNLAWHDGCIADVNVESASPMHPCKRTCDITGYEAAYYDPSSNLRYANADSFPIEYVQTYPALRNAAVVLK